MVGYAGRAWISDYGNPDDADDFDFIYPISPLHNVPSDKILPPLLLSTADREFVLILSIYLTLDGTTLNAGFSRR
jgi:hypothetical protein